MAGGRSGAAGWILPWVGVGLAAMSPARAGETRPEAIVAVPVSGAVIGRLARSDGGFPFLSEAAADRTACMLDPRWVRIRQLRSIVAKSRRDRDGAYVELVGATGPCMEAKGWVFVPCPGEGREGCGPPAPPPGEPGGG